VNGNSKRASSFDLKALAASNALPLLDLLSFHAVLSRITSL
jgi:hypothetical protein